MAFSSMMEGEPPNEAAAKRIYAEAYSLAPANTRLSPQSVEIYIGPSQIRGGTGIIREGRMWHSDRTSSKVAIKQLQPKFRN